MSASLAIRPTLYEETVPGGGHTSFVLKRGQLLRLTEGNVSQAARLAKRNRTEFYKLLQRHQLDPSLFKQPKS